MLPAIPMRRLALGLLLAACTTSAQRPMWQQRGNDASNSGVGAVVGPQTNAIRWNVACRPGFGMQSSPVIAADGTVMFGAADGRFCALSGRTGAVLWTYPTGAPVTSQAAISPDSSTVFVGSTSRLFSALNTGTGALVWSYTAGADGFSDATTDGTAVYTISDRVYCFDGATGAVRWTFSLSRGSSFGASPVLWGSTLIVATSLDSNSNVVYALHAANGTVRWAYDNIGSKPAGNIVVSAISGAIYYVGTSGRLTVLNGATGAYVSDRSLSGSTASKIPIALGSDGTLYACVPGGQAGSFEVVAYANGGAGSLRWAHRLECGMGGRSFAIGDDNTIYLTTSCTTGAPVRMLEAVTGATGIQKFAVTTGSTNIDSSPALDAWGNVYFGTSIGELFAVGPSPPTSSVTPSGSPTGSGTPMSTSTATTTPSVGATPSGTLSAQATSAAASVSPATSPSGTGTAGATPAGSQGVSASGSAASSATPSASGSARAAESLGAGPPGGGPPPDQGPAIAGALVSVGFLAAAVAGLVFYRRQSASTPGALLPAAWTRTPLSSAPRTKHTLAAGNAPALPADEYVPVHIDVGAGAGAGDSDSAQARL